MGHSPTYGPGSSSAAYNNTMPLFAFDRATIAHHGVPVVRDLSWIVHNDEAWAVVGPGGCGKTTLLETIAGKHRVVAGTFTPPPAARLVPFRETSRLFSPERFYYQQRFDFADAAECHTVREYLLNGQPGTEVEAVAERLRVGSLLDVAMLKLSNGQTRRVRLARGLLARTPLLLLDDPFSGLDATGRAEFAELLAEVVRDGQRLLLAARAEDVPPWMRVLELPGVVQAPGLPRVEDEREPHTRWHARGEGQKAEIIDLRSVSVRHSGKTLLDDITWTVPEGERWAVLGPNGAGKTTLLSLICGDHPQAFANHVKVFGRQRGEETLWELKRRIGLVSPELHACFPPAHTALSAAVTGFAGHLTVGPHTPAQADSVRRLFELFGLSDFAARPWRTLSAGTQRAILVVRALAPTPPLVVLDEPFQGMDADRVRVLRSWLDEHLTPLQTLLMVTHRSEELPASVTHRLTLADGRVVS